MAEYSAYEIVAGKFADQVRGLLPRWTLRDRARMGLQDALFRSWPIGRDAMRCVLLMRPPNAAGAWSPAVAVGRESSRGRFVALGLFSLLMALLLIGSAAAQRPSEAQAAAIRSNCRSDYMSYCSSVPAGGMASLQCLQQHTAQLSPPCRSAVQVTEAPSAPPASTAAAPAALPPMTFREELRLMRDACGRDFETYCRGVRLGGGRAAGAAWRRMSRGFLRPARERWPKRALAGETFNPSATTLVSCSPR